MDEFLFLQNAESFWDWHTGTGFSSTGGASATVNTWNLIAVVRNGTTAQYYLNGVPSGPEATAAKSIIYPSNYLYLGADARDTSHYFTGWMGEMVVLNQALTTSQVRALYASERRAYA